MTGFEKRLRGHKDLIKFFTSKALGLWQKDGHTDCILLHIKFKEVRALLEEVELKKIDREAIIISLVERSVSFYNVHDIIHCAARRQQNENELYSIANYIFRGTLYIAISVYGYSGR